MSSSMSSDEIMKREIADKIGNSENLRLRIFPESSNSDQELFENGGLTFSFDGIDYGSCDACWFTEENGICTPVVALEGTDALNRGSSGDAQYQRFHHALGAVLNGHIGMYYLRKGKLNVQPDLYEMAYNATVRSQNGGTYLIVQELDEIAALLHLITTCGKESDEVHQFLEKKLRWMHEFWYENKFSQYEFSYESFASKRSTVVYDDYVIKVTGRMVRNFTDSSQRAGHIAVGEMYLTKYLFDKPVIYLCPRMTQDDILKLDIVKASDKEWSILRKERGVIVKGRDSIIGLDDRTERLLASVKDVPLKGIHLRIYNNCRKIIEQGLRDGTFSMRV